MKFLLLLCSALFSAVRAQPQPFIGKSTHAGSTRSAVPAGKWNRKYYPMVEEESDCPNAVCTCGSQGRSYLKVSLDGNSSNGAGFGIHIVDSRGYEDSRAKANGGETVQQIEDIFTAQINGFKDFDTNNNVKAWSDYHTALWAKDGLDSYMAAFKKDSVPFQLGSWKDNSSTVYWSLLVQTPQTQFIAELMGKCSGCSAEPHTTFEERRGVPGESSAEHLMSAVHISRAVTSVDAIVAFYKMIFGINPVSTQALKDGTKIVELEMVAGDVRLRFVERPAAQTGTHTTKWFEDFLNGVATKYMTSYKSCWPVHGDDHWGGSNGKNLADVVAIFDKQKLPYHLFASEQGHINGYFYEPSGWQMNLFGRWGTAPTPPDVEKFDRFYCMKSCYTAQ